MRYVIDYDVSMDAVSLVCDIADNSCMESCINFMAEAETLTVRFNRGGAGYETIIPVVDGSACYMLPDTQMRAAGEFTICTQGCTPLRFIVEAEVPDGVEYSINYAYGDFYVRYVAAGGGGADDWVRPKITLERLSNGVLITVTDADGVQTAMVYDGVGGAASDDFACSFYINGDGHLICAYTSDEAPPFAINADGHLVYIYADGEEAPLLSINEDGRLIYTPEV